MRRSISSEENCGYRNETAAAQLGIVCMTKCTTGKNNNLYSNNFSLGVQKIILCFLCLLLKYEIMKSHSIVRYDFPLIGACILTGTF